jgi:hypothetical protein
MQTKALAPLIYCRGRLDPILDNLLCKLNEKHPQFLSHRVPALTWQTDWDHPDYSGPVKIIVEAIQNCHQILSGMFGDWEDYNGLFANFSTYNVINDFKKFSH